MTQRLLGVTQLRKPLETLHVRFSRENKAWFSLGSQTSLLSEKEVQAQFPEVLAVPSAPPQSLPEAQSWGTLRGQARVPVGSPQGADWEQGAFLLCSLLFNTHPLSHTSQVERIRGPVSSPPDKEKVPRVVSLEKRRKQNVLIPRGGEGS